MKDNPSGGYLALQSCSTKSVAVAICKVAIKRLPEAIGRRSIAGNDIADELAKEDVVSKVEIPVPYRKVKHTAHIRTDFVLSGEQTLGTSKGLQYRFKVRVSHRR